MIFFKLFLALFFIGSLAACGSEKPDPAPMPTIPMSEEQAETSMGIGAANYFKFSTEEGPDSFFVNISGRSLLEGSFHFSIVQFGSGKKLYETTFPSIDLLKGTADTSEQDKNFAMQIALQDYVGKDRLVEGIEEFNVSDGVLTEDIWKTMKNQKNIVHFESSLGGQDANYLAYSKELDKVIVYFQKRAEPEDISE